MKAILKINRWQLLASIVAIFFLNFLAGNVEQISAPATVLGISLLIAVAFTWIASLWLVSVSFDRAPGQVTFKIFFVIMIAWLILNIFGALFFSDVLKANIGGIIWPINWSASVSIFYCLGYSAKRLVSIEKGEDAKFGEYLGIAVLWYFYPFGFWIIQPKLNRLYRTISFQTQSTE